MKVSELAADRDRIKAELASLELIIAQRAEPGRQEDVPVSNDPIRVLFVCTGNSARSQIAEAILGRLGGPDFEVCSAGTDPKGVNPYAVRVLGELGIDWTAARSESVDAYAGRSFDYVITVCDRARQSCPVFPGSYDALHWGLEDPAEVEGSDEEKLQAFRLTASELTRRIRPFAEVARTASGRVRSSSTS